ncbi:MAG: hypothetical protein IIC67_04230 [Thaumarchaeota archaeon]|nr:hypothetical protein [Nitrososphaerota archaeon]
MSIWGPLGVAIGIVGLIAQANAPRCPTCGTKLVIISNYCINCKVSWGNLK